MHMYAYVYTHIHTHIYGKGVVEEKLGFLDWVRSEKWDNVCA